MSENCLMFMPETDDVKKIRTLLENNRMSWRYGDSTVWSDSAHVDTVIRGQRVRVDIRVNNNMHHLVKGTLKKDRIDKIVPKDITVYVYPSNQCGPTDSNIAIRVTKVPKNLMDLMVEILKDYESHYRSIRDARAKEAKRLEEQSKYKDLVKARTNLAACVAGKFAVLPDAEKELENSKTIARKVLNSKLLHWDDAKALPVDLSKAYGSFCVGLYCAEHGMYLSVKLSERANFAGDKSFLYIECGWNSDIIDSEYTSFHRSSRAVALELQEDDPLIKLFKKRFKKAHKEYTARLEQERILAEKRKAEEAAEHKKELAEFIDTVLDREPEEVTEEIPNPVPPDIYGQY